MKLPMLVVDKNIEVSEREQAEWLKHGIHTVRVDAMQEAIDKLSRESFYIIAINADNVNYLPLLRIMSDMTTVHIFIVDSHFTIEKQNEAFDNGATGYAQFYDNAEKNVQSALSYLKSIHKRSKTLKHTLKTIKCGNLTIVADHSKVFCNDMEVIFTAQEYEI